MHVHSINLQNQSKLMNDYRNQKPTIMQYFDFNPFKSDVFEKRLDDLKHKNINREQLADLLHSINTKWNAPSSTVKNINRLRDPNSAVVIGGQQAGVLTGPMYTINKIISIIHLAKQQEEQLNVPVIPVFWIAGEDHDFDEINHIFMSDQLKMKKYTVNQHVMEKKAVSNIEIDEEAAHKWLTRLFTELNETEHTSELHDNLSVFLDESKTYTDFFLKIIFHLFRNEGLVLIDSNDKELRHYESNYFINLIDNQPKTTEAIKSSFESLQTQGYSVSVEVESSDANLFYQHGNDRILLVRDENNDWVGKKLEVRFTTDEMLEIAKNNPELLSNNVMTRPLMQEMIFPTLAFIAGPGEISYWSILKKAFHYNDMKMPPVIPRLSFTFIDRPIEKLLKKYDISPAAAVNNGVLDAKNEWLRAKSNPPVEEVATQLKQSIIEAHQPIRKLAKSVQADLGDLSEKNLDYLIRDIEFLEKRISKTIEEKYTLELDEFNSLQLALHPNGGLQERVWNPLPWMNKYGIYFIHQLSEQSCSYENEHYVVYL